MTRICWSLVGRLSSLLEPNERDAVLGDIAESNEASSQALWSVLGLVLRRQATLWKDWRPWVALVGLVGLVGLQLNHMLVLLSFAPSMHLRTYWKYGVRYEHGLTPFEETVMLLCHALALMVWSWTSGFVLGSLSRGTLWLTGTLYFLLCAYPLLLGVVLLPLYFFANRSEPLVLLILALQIFLQTILLVLPSISGVRQGLRKLALTLPQTSVLAAVVVTLAILATWTGGWPGAAVVRWSGGVWDASVGWQNRLLSFAVVSWPVGYLFAIAISQRQTKTVHP